jgi:hypothetical protein
VFAGIEVPIGLLEERMHENGVKFDVTAIGYGMRGANLQPIVERFEGKKIPPKTPLSIYFGAILSLQIWSRCMNGMPRKLAKYSITTLKVFFGPWNIVCH